MGKQVIVQDLPEDLKRRYLETLVWLTYQDDCEIDEREVYELQILMTQLECDAESRRVIRDRIADPADLDPRELVEQIGNLVPDETLGVIGYSLIKDAVRLDHSASAKAGLGRHERGMRRLADLLGVTDEQIALIERACDLDRKILRGELSDGQIVNIAKDLAAKAGGVGVPIAAIYLSGSVTGLSAAGITSGLAALGLGGALGLSAMVTGIGAAVLTGVVAYKGLRRLLNLPGRDKSLRRELMLRDVLRIHQKAIANLAEDIANFAERLARLATDVETNRVTIEKLSKELTLLRKAFGRLRQGENRLERELEAEIEQTLTVADANEDTPEAQPPDMRNPIGPSPAPAETAPAISAASSKEQPRKKSPTKGSEWALVVQRDQIVKVARHLASQNRQADGLENESGHQGTSLSELEAGLVEAWQAAGLPRPDTAKMSDQKIDGRLLPTAAERSAIGRSLPDLAPGLAIPDADGDWSEYLQQTNRYLDEHGIGTETDPLEQLLPPHRAAEIRRQFDRDFGSTTWDRCDYAAVAITVLAGTLLDYFLVATPGAAFKGEPQRGSTVTAWMKEQSGKLAPSSNAGDLPRNAFQSWVAGLTTKTEDWAKVPYDVVSPKLDLTPNTHRLAAIGHDPVLGLVFGAKDIICRTCTFIDSNGAWRVISGPAYAERGVLEALATVVAHGFSDAFTPKGLPPPFLSALQALKANSGFTLTDGGDPVSVPNLVRHMYSNGYDLRHFATMAIVPATAELTIRTYQFARTRGHDEECGRDGIGGRLKLSQMLALTHGLLASGNILKTALYGWNPTALNMAQFLALGKQMISLVKLSSERNSLIQQNLAEGWEELLKESLRTDRINRTPADR